MEWLRRITVIVWTLVFATQAFAQMEKNDRIIGGNISGGFDKSRSSLGITTERYRAAINTRYGFFLAKRFVLGSGLSFEYASSRFDIDIRNRSESMNFALGLNPFARYYLGKSLFSELSTSFETIRLSNRDLTNGVLQESNVADIRGFTLAPGLGFFHFLTSSVAIEAIAAYRFSSKTSNTESLEYDRRVNSLIFSVGLQVFLN